MNSAMGMASIFMEWQKAMVHRDFGSGVMTALMAKAFYLNLQTFLRPRYSFEIGAHEADFSQQMRQLFPDVTVFAFEANPTVHAHFKGQTNFAAKRIAYLNTAVSDSNDPVPFHVVEGISGQSSLLNRDYANKATSTIMIRSVTGDAFAASVEADAIALWIDVEGAAEPVLRGFEKTISQQRVSSVLIEVENDRIWENQWVERDVVAFFLDRDYLPVYCDDEYVDQHNIVFVRASDVTDDLLAFVTATYSGLLKDWSAANAG